jgi:hypothetical protein
LPAVRHHGGWSLPSVVAVAPHAVGIWLSPETGIYGSRFV